MISYEIVLASLEKHIARAKQADTEQQMREELSAIKALCDVVLNTATTQTKNAQTHQQQVQTVKSVSLTMPQSVIQNQPKLQEDGANGDSIFDF